MNVLFQGQTYRPGAERRRPGRPKLGRHRQRRRVREKSAGKQAVAGGYLFTSPTVMVHPELILQEKKDEYLSLGSLSPASNVGRGEGQSGVMERYKARLDVQVGQQMQTYQSGLNIANPQWQGAATDYGGTLGRHVPYAGGQSVYSPSRPAPAPAATPSEPVPAATLPVLPPATEGVELGTLKGKASVAPSYSICKPSLGNAARPAGRGRRFGQPRLRSAHARRALSLHHPAGDVEITARHVSGDLLRRLIGVAAVAVALLVLWFVVRVVRRGKFAPPRQPIAAVVLIFAGLISLCGGVLPLVGLAAIAIGCGLEIYRQTTLRRGTS